jgi:hypothetical protein
METECFLWGADWKKVHCLVKKRKLKKNLIPIKCATSTRRMSGHCLGTFRTGNIDSLLHPLKVVSLTTSPRLSLSLSLSLLGELRARGNTRDVPNMDDVVWKVCWDKWSRPLRVQMNFTSVLQGNGHVGWQSHGLYDATALSISLSPRGECRRCCSAICLQGEENSKRRKWSWRNKRKMKSGPVAFRSRVVYRAGRRAGWQGSRGEYSVSSWLYLSWSKVSIFYVIWRFFTVITRSRHWYLSWNTTEHHIHSNIILLSMARF